MEDGGGGRSEAAGQAGVLSYRLEAYAEWHTILKTFNLWIALL